MTGEEFRALEREANDAIEKIIGEFKKRIKELYAIAIESGHGTKFGWLEEPLEWPDERDFETEDEYEDAEDRYIEFRNCAIGFVYMDDHNFTVFNGFAFEIDEDGNVAFTSVESAEDESRGDYYTDQWYDFTPWVESNWERCGYIVRRIESELGIE
mgnify:CR=1 FL=1